MMKYVLVFLVFYSCSSGLKIKYISNNSVPICYFRSDYICEIDTSKYKIVSEGMGLSIKGKSLSVYLNPLEEYGEIKITNRNSKKIEFFKKYHAAQYRLAVGIYGASPDLSWQSSIPLKFKPPGSCRLEIVDLNHMGLPFGIKRFTAVFTVKDSMILEESNGGYFTEKQLDLMDKQDRSCPIRIHEVNLINVNDRILASTLPILIYVRW